MYYQSPVKERRTTKKHAVVVHVPFALFVQFIYTGSTNMLEGQHTVNTEQLNKFYNKNNVRLFLNYSFTF